jgi:hypothetical protein
MDRRPLPRRRLALAGLFACALLPAGAGAQPPVPATVVRFVPGTSSVSINGQLKGPEDDARDYVVRAEGGQTLGVRLQRASPETYFVVLHPYGDKVYGNEGDQRTSWSDRLVDGGDYRVRVYLAREAARQAKGSAFTLVIDLK